MATESSDIITKAKFQWSDRSKDVIKENKLPKEIHLSAEIIENKRMKKALILRAYVLDSMHEFSGSNEICDHDALKEVNNSLMYNLYYTLNTSDSSVPFQYSILEQDLEHYFKIELQIIEYLALKLYSEGKNSIKTNDVIKHAKENFKAENNKISNLIRLGIMEVNSNNELSFINPKLAKYFVARAILKCVTNKNAAETSPLMILIGTLKGFVTHIHEKDSECYEILKDCAKSTPDCSDFVDALDRLETKFKWSERALEIIKKNDLGKLLIGKTWVEGIMLQAARFNKKDIENHLYLNSIEIIGDERLLKIITLAFMRNLYFITNPPKEGEIYKHSILDNDLKDTFATELELMGYLAIKLLVEAKTSINIVKEAMLPNLIRLGIMEMKNDSEITFINKKLLHYFVAHALVDCLQNPEKHPAMEIIGSVEEFVEKNLSQHTECYDFFISAAKRTREGHNFLKAMQVTQEKKKKPAAKPR